MAKSETGYVVKIRGFVPVDKGDLAGHSRVIEALRKAQDGEDRSPLFALLKVEAIEIKATTRRKDSIGDPDFREVE